MRELTILSYCVFLCWAAITDLSETLEQESGEQPYTSETILILLVRKIWVVNNATLIAFKKTFH